MALMDSPDRYGTVTRTLHWGMAALFALQLLSALGRIAFERDHPVRDALWSYHTDLGVTLFALVLLRGVWGLINLRRRPGHSGPLARATAAGHLALYGLMIVVPLLRIAGAAGGTRGLSWFGLPILPARETEAPWADVLTEYHGELGWTLFALVAGHIAMAVIWHHRIKRDGTLARMAGRGGA